MVWHKGFNSNGWIGICINNSHSNNTARRILTHSVEMFLLIRDWLNIRIRMLFRLTHSLNMGDFTHKQS